MSSMPLAQPVPAPTRLDPFLSQKLKFWSLVAMLLLVYVHAYNLHPRYLQPFTPVQEPLTAGTWLQYFLANGLLRFRIPILFAISGYLFARREGHEPHGARVRRRLRTLGLPYLLWSLLWLGALWALEQFPITRQAVIDAEISPFWPRQLLSQYSVGELVQRWLVMPAPFQLWFLRSLLVYNLAYPWLRIAVLRRPGIYFGLAGLLWFFMVPLPLVEGEGLLFFGLGVWLALRDKNVLAPPAWFRPGLVAALWVGATVVKTWLAFHAGPPFSVPLAVLMLALHKLGEISGMLTAWFGLNGLVRWCMARGWFRWLTGFSFMIYVLHVPFVNYATELALRYAPAVPHVHLLTYLVLPLLVILVSVGVGALLRWAVPGIYATLTGGRGLATS
ncbi:acyltransferase [Hymenobacter sp. BT770]|uniref:acyltransferase family protein n=1 Tax=Hymenobacter sp. BT770 TaxID=2886942 RepID=UPI001D104EDC|nr:acyltransferase [Hymenobacter sp. BT770]MCC3151878.1 acyltransferase [Hymenobacter sp. BT770]MDO3413500.1 acyltransferase [Hymenobacter sp. BT770]